MPDEMTNDLPNEETDSPDFAGQQNFYKVEKWTKDGTKVDRMLYAGNNLDKARELFRQAVKHRPRIRLTVAGGVAEIASSIGGVGIIFVSLAFCVTYPLPRKARMRPRRF
jgi:hypothetical protein